MFGNHKHEKFTGPFGSTYTIDEVVNATLEKHNSMVRAFFELETKVLTLQSDLAAIHAHYRSELCNDCCHSEVCKLRPNVRYGFECEDKAYELEVMTFEVEPVKVEVEPNKEETNANHI